MKKTYQEIKRILVHDLGFRDLAAYRRWVDDVRPTTQPTASDIARLSPDVIDCRAFWKVCDELFGIDPVCNVVTAPEVGALPFDVETPMDANRMNLRLAKTFGITSFLEEHASARLRVLEVGSGYGSLKHFVETHTNHIYVGVDAVPRVPGVIESTSEGFLPPELVEQQRGTFAYVVSSNVFQHFSARQRKRIVQDCHSLLRAGGLLMFNLSVDTPKLPAYTRDADGNAWAVHYGQYTPIPKGPVAYQLASEGFDILYVTQRYDGVFHFVCQRK